jgi:DNA modification methylase
MKKSFVTKYCSAYNSSIEDFLDSKEGKALQGKVQLIFTSPPFPLVVPKKYGNKIGEDYLNWMAELSPRLTKLLKPNGSMVIEAGLVGYADPNINVVRANAFDAIKFTLEAEGVEQEIEFTEKVISIEELK